MAAASLFGRLHYGTGKRRQQLKWCACATAVLVSGATVAETLGVSWLRWPGFALVMAGAVGLPVAVAIAILRHNLFDIDLIIDLTLLYGVLTAALAGTIEGPLAVLDHLFLVRVGQESEAAIFVSAVAIAIMYAPLRRRIEGVLGRVVRRPEDTVRRPHACSHSTFSDGRAREEEYPDGPVVGRAPGTGGEIALSERAPWGAGVAGDRGTSV